jgi:hypothetical protein
MSTNHGELPFITRLVNDAARESLSPNYNACQADHYGSPLLGQPACDCGRCRMWASVRRGQRLQANQSLDRMEKLRKTSTLPLILLHALVPESVAGIAAALSFLIIFSLPQSVVRQSSPPPSNPIHEAPVGTPVTHKMIINALPPPEPVPVPGVPQDFRFN